jgi:hypothetical protein
MLPNEENGRRQIREHFEDNFALCEEMLQLGLDALGWGRGPEGQGRIAFNSSMKGVSKTTFWLSLGLFAKCCKQLRSILLLCEHGLVSDADTLARSLFESVLALNFLLSPRLTLRENGKKVQPDPKKPLTTPFRTLLYLAHVAFEDERRTVKFHQTVRLKRLAKHLGDSVSIRQTAQNAAQRIGTEWTKRLKGKTTYCGVSIRDLSDSLRVLHWYNSVYDIQSSVVHARDAIGFADFSETSEEESYLDLGPNCDWIGGSLHVSSALFLGAISIVNSRLGLGVDERVDALVAKVKEMGRGERSEC